MTSLLARVKRIHLIGIGGSGLSAIARLLMESGYSVSGSDRTPSPLSQDLADAGARVFAGHHAENINGVDLVVRSSAIPDNNVEVLSAQSAGIPVLKRSQFLGSLLENRYGIAVAGTHGKTTITAMLAWLLVRLGQDPSYIIGGTARNLDNKNAHAGQGRAFVIEADEYDRMFLGLDPDLIVVSSLEHDHPDCFPTAADYYNAFVEFTHRLRPGGVLLTCLDSREAGRLISDAPQSARTFTYGTNPQADYTARALKINPQGGYDYEAWHRPQSSNQAVLLPNVSLRVPGVHNVRNSLAALAAFHQTGLLEQTPEILQQAALALSEYSGAGRRFDILGEAAGIIVVDDYAHNPAKIQAALSAARACYPGKRIWAVWQPHTYSRTIALMDDFLQSFRDADQVVVTEVYAAREQSKDFGNFSSSSLVPLIVHPQAARYTGSLDETSAYLLDRLLPNDVVLVLSAGDADQVSARVLSALKERIA